MQDKNFQYGLTFGSRSNEKWQDVYDEFIAADIAEAQSHLHELPESERRGLSLDTLRHFGCGYLEKWVHSQLRAKFVCGVVNEKTGKPVWLPPPSERLIIPTSSMDHFNAVATPRARAKIRNEQIDLAIKRGQSEVAGEKRAKELYKQHAGDMELFCDPDALKADDIVLVEGEIDAMSIWQATQGKVPVAAILGCGNSSATLGKRLRGDLKGKRFVILFDADAPGKKAAEKFYKKLIKERVPAVIRYLFDYMLPVDKKPPQAIHVDANELLQYYSAERLRITLKQALNTVKQDLDNVAAQIDKEIAAAGTEDAGANLKVISTALKRGITLDAQDESTVDKSARQASFVSDTDAPGIITTALKYVKARYLDRAEWFSVGCVMKRYGFELADFDRWSNDGDDRYSAESCRQQWNSMKSSDELSEDAGYRIGTLIKLAKTYSKEFALLFSKPANATAPAQDSASDIEPAATDNASASQAEQFSSGDPALDDDIRAQLKTWQEDKGKINPAVVKEIFAAAAYVSKLNADNFKREEADDLVVRRRIALLKCYAPKFATKFFVFLRGVKVTNVRDIEREIDKGKRRIEEKQKDFQREQADADAAVRRNARARAVTNNIEELQRLRNEPPSTDRDYKMRDLIRETVDWQLDRQGERVAVKANAANLHTIFTFDPELDGLFGYEQFVEADVFLKPPPWDPEKQRGDEWHDRDDAQLRMYLRTNYTDFKDKDLILEGVVAYSGKRAFHPIKDFFRNLPTWDKQLRAERIFCKYLGAEDNAFNREVTLNWLTAAVARIFHPGCNYQLCPILKGAQGIGKSFIIETLGGRWYSALNHDVNSEQAFEVLRNSWICEFKELKAMRKADVNSIKAFIDTSSDNRRAKYDRRAKIFKRHCVTIATTNDEQFLSDVTGNRRFPIVVCSNPRGQHGEQPSVDEIAQIWAEVFCRYCEMFNGRFNDAGNFIDEFDAKKLNLSDEAKPLVEELADQHLRDDGLKGEVQAFLNIPIPATVIWKLLTKDERRKFFADGKITIERDALHARFYPANKNRQPSEKLRAAYETAITPNNFVKLCTIRTSFGEVDALTFYGTEQRQHICAAEILNEAFVNFDRRVSMRRIIEVLSQLEGWTQGKRIKSYSVYGDQRNIFYRDADNQPTEPPADNTDYDFDGEPIDKFDVPDFKKDRVED